MPRSRSANGIKRHDELLEQYIAALPELRARGEALRADVPVENILDVAALCSVNTQTAGLALGGRHLQVAEALTARGVERCPEVGRMALYDAPWDGLYPMDRMVRWVSA